MEERITVQWEPLDGPPRKISFEQGPLGWNLYTKRWDGTEWKETDCEVVTDPWVYAPDYATDTERTPTALKPLLRKIRGTWHADETKALVFERPVNPLVIVNRRVTLWYYSEQLATAQPITEAVLSDLTRTLGLPSVRNLSATPFSHEDFTEGDFDVC